KKYLETNLRKGYIWPSESLMALLVLFMPKKNRKLQLYHFCVDYYKLNTIIKKDVYLILLI
ncbi:hypothetical protein K469DRAFT_544274, partial [Zopfia rhizophila CBS 207.26]